MFFSFVISCVRPSPKLERGMHLLWGFQLVYPGNKEEKRKIWYSASNIKMEFFFLVCRKAIHLRSRLFQEGRRVSRLDWGTGSWCFLCSQWGKRMKELNLIIHSQMESGRKRISSRKEDSPTKVMLKVEASMGKQRKDPSSALLGSHLMPLDRCSHTPAAQGWPESDFRVSKKAALLTKRHLGSRRLQVGLCGLGFTGRLQGIP